MTQEMIVQPMAAETLERVLVSGDLSKLSAQERLHYYRHVCESLGINALTQPFAYIQLNGKLTLYAKRDCTDQLRATRGISVSIVSRERHEDLSIVTARATDKNGRTDESIGAVSLAGLKGEALANALMKSETKSKRRVTLSIVGLGWLDETEIDTIADARPAEPEPQKAPPQQQTYNNGFLPSTSYTGTISALEYRTDKRPARIVLETERGLLELYFWTRPPCLKEMEEAQAKQLVGSVATVMFLNNQAKDGTVYRHLKVMELDMDADGSAEAMQADA